MRSRSRVLWQDKAKYFRELETAGNSKADIDQVRQANTALLAQYARMKAVENALGGKEGLDMETDYRGQSTLVSYSPVDIDGLRWVIVASMETSEAFAPLDHLTRMILCWSVLIVLLVTVLAAVMAHFFVRPIHRLADGVKQFRSGNTDTVIQFASHDEYQDLGAAFNEMTQRIHKQTEQFSAQERRNNELLLNLAPPAFAARLAKGEQNVTELYADVTVLVARLSSFTEATRSLAAETSVVALFNELITAFDEAAERHGVEKRKTRGYNYIAVSGMAEQRLDHSRRMVEFARVILRILSRFDREHGMNLTICISLNAGPITGGVVGHTKYSYDVFGETVDHARAMLSESQANTVLVSRSAIHDLYLFYGPFQIPDADGSDVMAWALQSAPPVGPMGAKRSTHWQRPMPRRRRRDSI